MTGKKSFTLVELLVVIIIVGILAAVSIPIVLGNVEKAKWTEAIQTLGTIRGALRLYYVEFKDYPSVLYYLNNNPDTSPKKNCPLSLDIGAPDADADGRYIYYTTSESDHPECAVVIHDEDDSGDYSAGESHIVIFLDGHLDSRGGAPEF